MDKDEGIRGRYAAAFSLLPGRDGKFRVFLDLLKLRSQHDYEREWGHELFVTIATVEREKLIQSQFSPEELQRIGSLVISELAVMHRMENEL